MKVLQLAINYQPSIGGHQVVMRRVAEGLAAEYGDEVTVFTSDALLAPGMPRPGRIAERKANINGVAVRRFRVARRAHAGVRLAARIASRLHGRFPRRLQPLRLGPISARMAVAAIAHDADVVCGAPLNFMTVYYGWAASRAPRRRPFVVYGALHLDGDPPARSVVRMARAADAYIAHTEYERRFVVERGAAPERVHVVPPGVDLPPADADGRRTRARFGWADDPVVGFIGRQTAYKGLDTLLAALPAVWSTLPDTRLLIAGAPTSWSPTLHALINALPEAQRVRVTVVGDFAEGDRPDLIAASDVVVSVSEGESFGIVYLEAWAAGRPVIGANRGAVQEVIVDGVDGIQVQPRDPSALSAALLTLLSDAGLRAEMGGAGRRKVEAHHRWPDVVARWRQALESACERKEDAGACAV